MVFRVINITINHSPLKGPMFGKSAKDYTLMTLIRRLLRRMEEIELLLVVKVVSKLLTCICSLKLAEKSINQEKKMTHLRRLLVQSLDKWEKWRNYLFQFQNIFSAIECLYHEFISLRIFAHQTLEKVRNSLL